MIEFNSAIVKYELLGESLPEVTLGEVITPNDVRLPDDSPARVKVLRSEGKKWYLTVVYHEESEQPFALFCRTNNADKTAQTSDAIERLLDLARRKGIYPEHIEGVIEKTKTETNVAKLTRAISLLLRHGVLVKNVVAELDKMEDIFVGSFLFQVKKFLSQYIKEGEVYEGGACTECGGTLVFSEGCLSCLDCGGSKCS